MSIRTLYSRQQGERSVALVEVTEEGDRHTAWEFHCEQCDELDTCLSEHDAVDLLTAHRCPVEP